MSKDDGLSSFLLDGNIDIMNTTNNQSSMSFNDNMIQSAPKSILPPTVIMLPQLIQSQSKSMMGKNKIDVDKSLARRTRKKRRVLSRSGNDDEAFKMLEAEADILAYPSGFNTNPREFLEHILKIKRPGKKLKKMRALDVLRIMKDTSHLNKKSNASSIATNVMKALQHDDVDSLKWFLDKGFSVNYHNKFGETLLHHACRMQAVKCINELLERKVIVDVSSISGRTPLHQAIWFKEEISLCILRLLCGISPVLLVCGDWLGNTPLDNVSPLQWPVLCDFLNLSIDHYIEEFDKCMIDDSDDNKSNSSSSSSSSDGQVSQSPRRLKEVSNKADTSPQSSSDQDSRDGTRKRRKRRSETKY